MRILKITLAILLLLLCICFVLLEGGYWFKLHEMKPQKEVSNITFTQTISDVLWVSTGESNEIEIVPFSAVGYVYSFAKVAAGMDYENYRSAFPKGFTLSTFVARDIVHKSVDSRENWQLKNMVMSIWVSNNYTAEEAINYKLSSLYYGFGLTGLPRAAEFYFGKTETQLSLSEAITLIAITHSPARYNPYCNSDRLTLRGKYLVNQLATYDPKTYGSGSYQLPEFKVHEEIKCKNI